MEICFGDKCLSAVKNSTSFLKKHLQAKHNSATLLVRPIEEEENDAGGKARNRQVWVAQEVVCDTH